MNPPRPPRPGSRPAIELDGRVRGHVDHSLPPDDSPYPPVTPGVGSAPVVKYTVESAHKQMSSVWGILGILAAAFMGGWIGKAAFGQYLTSSSLLPMQESLTKVESTVAAMRETQISQQKDLEWIKATLRIAESQQPPLARQK